MKKIALFGGSFNPPHIGHQMMVFYLSSCYNFDEIWILPVFEHYFAKNKYLIEYSVRKTMAELAFSKISNKIFIKDIEEENKFNKSYETLSYLTENFKEYKFTLVLGEDNYNSRHNWYKFDEIEKMAEIIYLGRDGVTSELNLPFKFPQIASSKIRENVKENFLYLDKDVYDYILSNNLYLN